MDHDFRGQGQPGWNSWDSDVPNENDAGPTNLGTGLSLTLLKLQNRDGVHEVIFADVPCRKSENSRRRREKDKHTNIATVSLVLPSISPFSFFSLRTDSQPQHVLWPRVDKKLI